MRIIYMDNLLHHLRGICRWIFNIAPRLQEGMFRNPLIGILPSDVLPFDQDIRRAARFQEPVLRSQEDLKRERQLREKRPRDQRWWCSITIWYIMHHYGEVFEDDELREELYTCLAALQEINNDDSGTSAGTTSLEDVRVCYLRWYHSHCILQICRQLEKDDPVVYKSRGLHNTKVSKHKRWAENWQVKAEKTMRLFGKGRMKYESLDYDVGYLALLSLEITIPDRAITQQGRSCITYVKQLLHDCKRTTVLSPGRSSVVRWDPSSRHQIRSSKPRPAPWELNCLGHHIVLCLGMTSNPDACIDACKNFMLADYSFMSTWDQSKINTVSRWWNMETPSIICSKFLDDELGKCQPATKFASVDNDSWGNLLTTSRIEQGHDLYSTVGSDLDLAAMRRSSIKTKPKHFEESEVLGLTREDSRSLLENILDRLKEKPKFNDELELFSWEKRKPNKVYHADTTVQSLEDTPKVFELKQTRKVDIRPNIQKYMEKYKYSNQSDDAKQNWSLDNIEKMVPPTTLLHLSCFDLALLAEGNNAPEICIATRAGRAAQIFPRFPLPRQGTDEIEEDRTLTLLYVLGKANRHPRLKELTAPYQEIIKNDTARQAALKRHQESLFSILNDSVCNRTTTA
ncbi:hypothetical protein BGZ60DRAFT_219937 [Tricladium varicosporioides]|nr:hypothetical protein BGZ60DRAFT_219937 [Hymenoscyphus varicosporioides]